ncbi:unnamed protein product [Auanema sp. JU1783]|nr:unnamed protein product [Auanema sp. JU1783]
MTDCHSSYGSGLLPPTELVAAAAAAAAAAVEQFTSGAEKSSDQMSTISSSNTSTSAEQPSPPYSGSKSNDQFSPPESYMDQRTETPSSDQLHLDFSSNNGYSPDGTHSSDRDESPDTVSTSSGAELHADSTDIKPMISADDSELQRQLLRLQSFAESAGGDSNPQLNLLQAFSNSLLGDKLSASLLAEKLKQQVAAAAAASSASVNSSSNSVNSTASAVPLVPLGATLPHPITTDSTPTKRKRQRRNPVWPYFEVIDGTARCKQCLYSTKSVFSTNLKVHLRSHHRADYDKVIQAEDALNLNALLLSGNSNKLFSPDPRKRIPPMTSSILMTINKLANQTNNEDNPLNSVLRQTLAAGTLSQQLQQVQNHLAQQQKQQQQQSSVPQFPLNAANLAALNNLARNQFGSNNQSTDIQAPHGTDANGMPQPKRRRLRRHPVWMFFRDLEDRMVGCINCNFRTGSAFSTNLKMHLKAHHKEDYERVLKLEDDMRIEEGIFGPPNKMKSELIDFIRGGGNASTPQNNLNSANPKASPLVQQILNQTMGNRTGTSSPQLKKESSDDDPFSGMSMSDKLAALVGLAPPAGSVEGEVTDDDKSQTTFRSSSSSASNPFEELRRAAERIVAANMGLQPPPQEFTMVNLNGSIVQPEEKPSPTNSSTDICDDKKNDRDRALARFWLDQGGNDDLLTSEIFKELLRSLAPEYEIPAPSHLAALVEEEGALTTVGLH